MAHRLNRPTTVKLADRTIHLADPAHRYLVTAADGTTAEGMITGITSEPGRLDVTLGELDHELNYVTEIREVGTPATANEFRPPAEPTDPRTEVYVEYPDGEIFGPITRAPDGKWWMDKEHEICVSWSMFLATVSFNGAILRWHGQGLAPEND